MKNTPGTHYEGQNVRIPWSALAFITFTGAVLGMVFAVLAIEGSALYAFYGFRDGFLIAFLMGYYSLVLQRKLVYGAMGNWPFLARVVFNTFVYAVIFSAARSLINLLEGQALLPEFSNRFWLSMSYALILALLLNFLLEVIRLTGARVVWSFIAGTYRKPREEDRYFLFIDLAHSTALAEKLGNLEFMRLLSFFFFDLGHAVSLTGGEIYKYIGDEAIISWPRGQKNAALMAYRCFRIFQRRMHKRERRYRSEFSIVPEFRGGLHGGPVMTGAIGEARKEIAYLGDVVNTSARVIGVAKDLGETFVFSELVRNDLKKLGSFEFRELGVHEIRGREGKLTLYALDS
jgi:adenylate cyclase